MYNILQDIKSQLFDAPIEVKASFNKLVQYFSENNVGSPMLLDKIETIEDEGNKTPKSQLVDANADKAISIKGRILKFKPTKEIYDTPYLILVEGPNGEWDILKKFSAQIDADKYFKNEVKDTNKELVDVTQFFDDKGDRSNYKIINDRITELNTLIEEYNEAAKKLHTAYVSKINKSKTKIKEMILKSFEKPVAERLLKRFGF